MNTVKQLGSRIDKSSVTLNLMERKLDMSVRMSVARLGTLLVKTRFIRRA